MNALPVRSAKVFGALAALLLSVLPLAKACAAEAYEDAEWQITLLKPSDCGGCSFLEQSLKRRGTVQRTTLTDGRSEVTAVIERRVGGQVTTAEWEEIRRLPYFDERLWQQRVAERTVQVLLKRNGKVVAAGAIGDSADLRDARFPADLTTPLDGAEPDSVRNGFNGFWQELYLQSWNLDWFYRLARNPSVVTTRRFEEWIKHQPTLAPPALGPVNVLLASTGNGAFDNPVFNAIRTQEIEAVLTRELGVDASRIQVRYGPGPQRGFNAIEADRSGLRFVRRDVPRAQAFTIESLSAFFEGVRAQPKPPRNLIVLVGHGGPDGAPLWGEVTPLGAEEMQWLHQRGNGDDVIVSGNCFGGVLARAASCGFFGARPDVVATGCQADALEVANSKDYLHMYFEAFTPSGKDKADADHDGAVSFEEAHWYATRFGDDRNLTYSTVDALAEDWIAAHPDVLPDEISLAELQQLAAKAGAGERETLATLTRGLVGSHRFPLKDLAGQAARYSAAPTGPRPMIGQLARRLLYLSGAGSSPELAAVRSCGARSPASFLRP